MFCLKINGESLDMLPKFSISVNLKSSIFYDEGDFSFPFDLPTTPKNIRILKYRHVISNTVNPYLAYRATFTWKGITCFSGMIKIKTAVKGKIQAFFYPDKGDFNYSVKGLKLTDIDLGSMIFENVSDAFHFFNQSVIDNKFYPEVPFAFPTIDNELYYDPPAVDPGLLNYNYYQPEFSDPKGQLTKTEWASLLDPKPLTVIVPFISLCYVIGKVFSTFGYKLNDRFFTPDPDLVRLALYSSNNFNRTVNDLELTVNMFYNLMVPSILITDFLKGLKNKFSSYFFIDNVTSTVTIKSFNQIIADPAVVEFSENILSSQVEVEDEIKAINLTSQSDGDDDFYEEQMTQFEQSWIDRFKDPVATVEDLPPFPKSFPGDIRYVESTHKLYVFDITWTEFTMLNEYQYWTRFMMNGIDDVNIDSCIGTLCSNEHYAWDPWVKNKEANWTKITPRLIFIKFGMKEYDGFSAPKTWGTAWTDTLSLYYSGERGLYNRFWKEYIKWYRYSKKLLKIKKRITLLQLRQIDFSRKYRINNNTFLIKEIRFTITEGRDILAEFDLYLI